MSELVEIPAPEPAPVAWLKSAAAEEGGAPHFLHSSLGYPTSLLTTAVYGTRNLVTKHLLLRLI